MAVVWKKDGKLIWASYRYNMKMTHDTCVLDILDTDKEEAAGTYTCEVSNAEGTDICHARVKLGNPSAHHLIICLKLHICMRRNKLCHCS